MVIDTWYQWLMVYLYEIGGYLLIASSFVLARKTKKVAMYFAVAAFCAFVAGGDIQKRGQSSLFEAHQTKSDDSEALTLLLVGRALGSLGFVIGTGSFLWFAIKQQKT